MHPLPLSLALGAAFSLLVGGLGFNEDRWALAASVIALVLALTEGAVRERPLWARLRLGCLGGLAVACLLLILQVPALLVAPVLGAAALVSGVFLYFVPRPPRVLLAGLLVVGLVGGSVALTRVPPRDQPVHSWNLAHYLLGTKYFEELGYFDLYNAVLLADLDGPEQLTRVREVRDLRTYLASDRRAALAQAEEVGLRERFTDARWEEFKADVAGFDGHISPKLWSGIITDLGFNPSPAWLLVHEPLLQPVPLRGESTIPLLAHIQLPLLLAAGAASVWAFGWPATLWMLLWTALFFGNRGRLLGGYFTYDWAALTVLGAAFLAKGRGALSAPFVAYGGLMRGFSGLTALGPTLRAARGLLPGAESTLVSRRFLVALALCMALIIGGSGATSHGLSSWVEWSEKISLHSERISCGGRRIGMKTILGEDFSEPGSTEDMNRRRELVAERHDLLRAAQGGFMLLLLAALPRRSRFDGYALGLAAGFFAFVTSRYYFCAWMIWVLLGWEPKTRPEGHWAPKLAMFGMITMFCMSRILGEEGFAPTYQARYQWVNTWILLMSLGAILVYLALDVRALLASRRGAQAAAAGK